MSFCFSFLFFLSAFLNSPENQEIRLNECLEAYQRSLDLFPVYKQVEGKGLVEVTDQVDHTEAQELIAKQKRRIFVFEYPSDGLMVKGYISFVDDGTPKPLLVLLRGGNTILGLLSPWNAYSFIGDWTILSTTYRGGVCEGSDEFGGGDVADVKNLVAHIPVLEEELGLNLTSRGRYALGGSRGGLELFLALAKYPELQHFFDKVVSLSGLLDMEQCVRVRPDMKMTFEVLYGYRGEPEWLSVRNPLHYVDKIEKDLPILIVQGTEDIYVSLEEGKAMHQALKERGCAVEYLEVEGGAHCLSNIAGSAMLWIDWLIK